VQEKLRVKSSSKRRWSKVYRRLAEGDLHTRTEREKEKKRDG
jgi:hypothetical protein